MTFDRIDRQFAPRARAPEIRLECEGCGSTDDVATRSPFYWDLQDPIPLCLICMQASLTPRRLRTS